MSENKKTEDKSTPFPKAFSNWEKHGDEYSRHLGNIQDGKERIASNEQSVHIIMEHYCWLVDNNKLIPKDIQMYIASSFSKHLIGKQKLPTAFGMKKSSAGRKEKEQGLCNKRLFAVLWDIVVNGASLYKAKIAEAGGRSITTVTDYMKNKEMMRQAIFLVVLEAEMDCFKHLSEEQQLRLKGLGYDYSPINSIETLDKLKKQHASNMEKKAFGID